MTNTWFFENRLNEDDPLRLLFEKEIENSQIIERFDYDNFDAEEMGESILSRFDKIKLYHGTRIHNEKDFLKCGLRALDLEWVHLRITTILNEAEINFSNDDIFRLINEHKNPTCTGHVYFSATEKGLILTDCDHYIKYGSEFIYGILIRLIGEIRSEKLLQKGRPGILECEIPTSLISRYQLGDLAKRALHEILEPDYYPKHDNVSVSITSNLPPSCITKIKYLSEN